MYRDISVLIACFNAEDTVRYTIESILVQTLPPLEIVIVDDGSTDNSSGIVKEYGGQGVSLITSANFGAAAARNLAYQASTGDYIVFLDADDILGPRYLEAQRTKLTSTIRCLALSRWTRFISSVDEAIFPDRPTEFDMSGVDWLVTDWEFGAPMTQPGMFMIPRSLIDDYGGWHEELSLIDDFEFFARIISRSDGVRFAPDARLYYRSGRKGSLSSRNSDEAVLSAFHSLMAGTSHLLEVENSQRTRRACANLIKHFDYTYYPHHSELRRLACKRASELGGASAIPFGPPRFHSLRRFTGWKIARRVQHLAERLGLNSASRGAAHWTPTDPRAE